MPALDSAALERLIPDELRPGDVTGRETLELHLERYKFAAQHARAGRILDLACGVGYGTRHLAELLGPNAVELVGVDLSEEAIAYARKRYAGPRTQFLAGDGMAFSDPLGFDTIVSLETIEHVPDPVGFVRHLRTLLAPEGVLIVSVPTTLSTDANPHHLHDFTERSLRRMMRSLDGGLAEVAALRQVQPYRVLPLLTRQEERAKSVRRNLPRYYMTHPGLLLGRIATTVRHGFENHYLTVAWKAPAARPGVAVGDRLAARADRGH